MITTSQPDSQLIGETVTISYITDPSVGHGRFRLENYGDTSVIATVKLAWLEFGEHQQVLAGVTLFDIDQERMVNPESFTISAKSAETFLVGFPKVAHEPRFGEIAAVGLRLNANGINLQALSPIKFERRIPLGR
jgi:hypothetical protein